MNDLKSIAAAVAPGAAPAACSKKRVFGALAGGFLTSLALGGCVVSEGINYVSHAGSGFFERLNKQRGLERVARDWCLTVRASQVVPTYPLEEDLQPGDVYVVTTPIDQLKKYWNRHGYLPIDRRFGRLQPSGYGKYYADGAYGVAEKSSLPRMWQFPTVPKTAASGTTAANADFAITDWPKAPRAGFPSYSFRARGSEGFNGALPLQGVPVMLGALGARDVSGTVAFTDCYSYGIDETSIRRDLNRWLLEPDVRGEPVNKGTLKTSYARRRDDSEKLRRSPNYLRIITRVYLVRSVNVSMTNLEASDWKVSVGQPKPSANENALFDESKPEDKLLKSLNENIAAQTLAILPTTPPAAGEPPSPLLPAVGATEAETGAEQHLAEERRQLALKEQELAIKQQKVNQQIALNALQRSSSQDSFGGYVLPGGTLQMMSATNRTISMKETFARPLVIGYHALEFPILEDGSLGFSMPISTFNRVNNNQSFSVPRPYNPKEWETAAKTEPTAPAAGSPTPAKARAYDPKEWGE